MVLGFFKKLSKAFSSFGGKLRNLFQHQIDEETLEDLEQILYEGDLGVQTVKELTELVRKLHKKEPEIGADALIEALKVEVKTLLSKLPHELVEVANHPLVILIVGVNGNGKTTSVAKLAHHLHRQGKKVLIAAADTYRAAAVEQLEIWAKRIGVEIVKGAPKSDPAAVTFDALEAAKARLCDVVLIDTAGRLHTRNDLMEELRKIGRVCGKAHPKSPHETLLVLDATIGQNGVDQARIFNDFAPISGLILTKLDGTSKGGGVVHIQRELDIPVKFIGTGEQLEDFAPFDADAFAEKLFT